MLRRQNVKNSNNNKYKEIISYILRWNDRYQRKMML